MQLKINGTIFPAKVKIIHLCGGGGQGGGGGQWGGGGGRI